MSSSAPSTTVMAQRTSRSRQDRPPAMNHSVEARATAELQRSMYPAVRRVRCNYDGRRLKLTGRMPSFFTKQVALRIVFQSLQHAITIDDQLEVAGT